MFPPLVTGVGPGIPAFVARGLLSVPVLMCFPNFHGPLDPDDSWGGRGTGYKTSRAYGNNSQCYEGDKVSVSHGLPPWVWFYGFEVHCLPLDRGYDRPPERCLNRKEVISMGAEPTDKIGPFQPYPGSLELLLP